jgi:hypothetical protein
VLLKSEFATVRLVVDDTGNGTRLAITDVKTGRTNHFDPLELEALAWIDHDEMTQFMDPQRRWSEDDH